MSNCFDRGCNGCEACIEPETQAPDPAPARFPAAIWSLLLDVADRNGKPGLGPWQNGDGEPMQDDADAAIAWIKAAAIPAPEGEERTPAGFNRPPNGEPCNTDDWNAGYEAGFADGKAAPAPQATDAELERRTGEPHVDGWPLVSGLPAPAITEAEIDRVAALTEKAMEDGLRGFCRTWGWQQFARTLVENLRPYGLRIAPKEPTNDR